MPDEPKDETLKVIIEALKREQGLITDTIKGQIADFREAITGRFNDFKAEVDKRFDGVNRLIYTLIGLMVAGLLGGGIPLLIDVAGIKQEVKDTKEQLDDIKKNNTSISEVQKQTLSLVQQVAAKVSAPPTPPQPPPQPQPPPPPPFTPLAFDESQRELIHKYISIEKKGGPGLPIKLGQPAPDQAELEPIPVPLVEALPSLKGFRYIADYATGAIAITNPVNVIVAIV